MGLAQSAKDAASDYGNWGGVLGIGTATSDTATGMDFSTGLGAAFTGIEVLVTAREKKTYWANPLFVSHGFEDSENPATADYFKWRKRKKIGGALVSGFGSLGAAVTRVHVGGLARHGRAVTATVDHTIRFQLEAKKIPNSKYINGLIRVMT
ncbi:hypothetical protein MTR62_14760 [Novosphingobium sp. 1949]|uniref:Uncharacterized protein n=1 Tax=Novosphingobium organovorum TaxID=2930092 RepID=A0ABT0BGK4_9SPHN|nr:hypothetical protein [Novosphingobium organovorum]MCJ2183946.1 hypothetical protein [Novosphingobium organovorum]